MGYETPRNGYGSALPAGFVLDDDRVRKPANPAALPPGFTLDALPPATSTPARDPAALPPGFTLDEPGAPVVAAPVTAPADVGWFENVMRGAGERAFDVAGGAVSATAPLAAGEVETGRIEYDAMRQALADDPAALAALDEIMGGRVRTQEQAQVNVMETGADIASQLSDTSFGYEPGTTWDQVKASPLRKFLPFAFEQGLVSIPDMAAALANMPLYTVARTGELAQNRAENDKRPYATVDDMVKVLPASTIGALMERMGTRGILGLGEIAVDGLAKLPAAVAKAGVKEAGTEAVEEGAEYTATTLGTETPFEPEQLGEQMAAGAVAGGPFGAAVRTGSGAVELAKNKLPTKPAPGAPAPTSTLPEGFTLDPVSEPETEPVVAPVASEPVKPVETPPTPAPSPAASEPVATEPVVTTPATPPPVEQGPSTSFAPAVPSSPEPAPAPTPRTERVTTPDGGFETDVEFQVVEADQLKAAQGELQPRDRASRVGSDLQIASMASKLDPLRLMGSRESDRGSPIVDDEGTILSGNGRTAAIMAAMTSNPERYQAYRTSIEQMGFSTEGMKAPILVRRAKGISPDDKKRFATRSNSDGGLSLSSTERAGIEQDYVTPDMLARFDTDAEGGVSAASNGEFVRQFLRSAPENERASFVNKDGQLTPVGAQRISGAIFARAYGDKSLVERFVEDEKDPALRNALTGAAAAWAAMRDRVKGTPLDITSDLVSAISLINRAKNAGMTLTNFTAQGDAFNQTPKRVQDIARLFFNASGNRLAAWRDIRDRLRSYADQAARTGNATGDIFGGESATPESILQGIGEGVARNAAKEGPAPATPSAAQGGELFSGRETLSKGPKKGGGKSSGETKQAAGPSMLDAADADPEADPDLEDDLDFDQEDTTTDPDLFDTTRAPRGTLAPKTEQVSFTNRASMFEEAYRVAGLTPDEGTLLPPAQKRNVLARVLQQTFGFKVDLNVKGAKISTLDAVDQMLDAYRNIRFMMHALELPVKAISLDGTLTLALERFKGRYFGAYMPADRAIHMPGRSNSFAHEWAHALDHFLLDRLKPTARGHLLSQAARKDGLDPTVSIEHAFVNVIHRMFYNEADLALRIMDLEQEASKTIQKGPDAGKPTQAAITAQEQIERLATGATRLRIKPSKFRKDSADYSPASADYFASVHEMLARSFEAYVAHKVNALGGGSEFITKGEANYLGEADRRLKMTFPKDAERLRIFSAFDDLFDHIRTQQTLGTGPAADRPQDTDIVDPQHWNRVVLGMGEPGFLAALKQEVFAIRNVLRRDVDATFGERLRAGVSAAALRAGLNPEAGVRENARGALAGAYWAHKLILGSYRGFAKAHSRANKGKGSELLDLMIGRVMTDPGSGENKGRVQQTYEQARERETASVANEIASLLAANPTSTASGLAAKTGLASTVSAKANDNIRELLYGTAVPAASASERAIAAGLRRILDRSHRRATSAGIDVGYVENKGYLPRVLRLEAVEGDAARFLAQAAKVYEIQFDRLAAGIEPDALLDLARAISRRITPLLDPQRGPYAAELRAIRVAMATLAKAQNARPIEAKTVKDAEAALSLAMAALAAKVRPDYAKVSAADWYTRIVGGDSVTYDSHGPDTRFTKPRTLPPEADALLADFYNTDVLDLTMTYVHNVASRATYVERFGNSGGVTSLDTVLGRQDVRDAISQNPRRYDPDTERGRVNIIADLANPRTDNLLELALGQAVRTGASSEAVTAIRGAVANITGRQARDPHVTALSRVTGFVYIYTTLALLGRVTFASVVEPLTMFMRTGDVAATFRTFTAYVSELNRSSKSMQERAAIARAIGLVSAPLFDAVVMNRLSLDNQNSFRGNVLLSTYFRATLLTQLTNAQRRAVMVGSHLALHHMAREHADPNTSATRKRIIEADIRELGVPDPDIGDFLDYLGQSPDLPNLSELDSRAGKMWSAAVGRMTDETIQNPRRADKPAYASNPYGRLIWHLTSFLFAFFRNAVIANVIRAQRNAGIAKDDGVGALGVLGTAGLPVARNLIGGMAMLFVGQLLVTVVREALFSSEQWEEKDDDDERREWLLGLALSRTGVFGPGDIFVNSLLGLKYNRDLTSLPAGVGMTYVLSNVASILNGFPKWEMLWSGAGVGLRNSPKTNTAEHEAAKAVYRLLFAPIGAAVFASAPVAGPVTAAARFGALAMSGTNTAASTFADMLVGPKPKKKDD